MKESNLTANCATTRQTVKVIFHNMYVKSIHEGIKYDCKLCDYKAKQRNSLTKHVESIHEGFKFECQL